jgi:hypothetical protein
MSGGPSRAVWHTTSNTNDHTFANELGWFTGGGAGVAPHLLWDPFTGQIAQMFPANSRSLSLQNDGSVKTNRTGEYCIQIETVFTENETVGGKKYASVRSTPCKGWPSIVAWLNSLGIPNVWPGGAPTGWTRDTVSLDMWLTKPGNYGHNQIPGNSHVDPGPMPDFPAKPAPQYVKFPGAAFFKAAPNSPVVTAMGKRLVAVGCGAHYTSGPGPQWTESDRLNYQLWQRKCGMTGADADGWPGQTSWDLLHVPK